MQAASSPMTCTCGFRMVVWMGLLFLASTVDGQGAGHCGHPSTHSRAPRSPPSTQPPAHPPWLPFLESAGLHDSVFGHSPAPD
jgi:hypothetical protein